MKREEKMAKKKDETPKTKISGWQIIGATWRIISIGISALMLVFFLIIFASFASLLIPSEYETGNIAVIPIEGLITTDGPTSWAIGVKSKDIVELLEKAEKNKEIKAILLEINSPGGSPVGTDEIAQAVKRAEKPVIAVIRESGASGAYWIATAADKIFANRMSITGSIGVKASHLEFAGLIADYNITYREIAAGKYKEAGSPFKTMTEEEQKMFKKLVDTLHEDFITAVAENRNLSKEKVKEIATGFVYLGSEAKTLGLIDELGTKEDTIKYIEKTLNITAEPVEYKKKGTFFEELSSVTANNYYQMGRGIGSAFTQENSVSLS